MNGLRSMLAGLGAMALVVACLAIVSRYLAPGLAMDWADEVIVLCLSWATWTAAPLLAHERLHVRADVVSRVLGPGGRRSLRRLNDTLGALFSLGLAAGGFAVAHLAYRWGERSESTLHLPTWLYYLSLPLGVLGMAVVYARKALRKSE